MKLLCVAPDRASEFWPLAEKYIFASADRVGLLGGSKARDMVLCGSALLWLAADDEVRGAMVTALVDGVCEIIAYGADDFSKQIHLLKEIEDFARAENCAAVRMMGRKGWSRVLREYKTTALVMERPL